MVELDNPLLTELLIRSSATAERQRVSYSCSLIVHFSKHSSCSTTI